jgi:hypothetical protein
VALGAGAASPAGRVAIVCAGRSVPPKRPKLDGAPLGSVVTAWVPHVPSHGRPD